MGREQGGGAETTDKAPFLLESAHPITRDHRPVSFLHVNELFSHLLKEEKLHRCGRLGPGAHNYSHLHSSSSRINTGMCFAALWGEKEFRKKGGGVVLLPGLSIRSSRIHFHLGESESGNNSCSGFLKRGRLKRPGRGSRRQETGALCIRGTAPPGALIPRSLGENNFSPWVNQNQITQECGRTGLSFQVPLSLRI